MPSCSSLLPLCTPQFPVQDCWNPAGCGVELWVCRLYGAFRLIPSELRFRGCHQQQARSVVRILIGGSGCWDWGEPRVRKADISAVSVHLLIKERIPWQK